MQSLEDVPEETLRELSGPGGPIACKWCSTCDHHYRFCTCAAPTFVCRVEGKFTPLPNEPGGPITLAQVMLAPMAVQVMESPCPCCKGIIRAAAGAAGRGPKPGDPCVCVECGAELVFGDAFALRKMTDEDRQAMGPEMCEQIRYAVGQVMARNRRN